MTSASGSGSKRRAASESDPIEACSTPNRLRTCFRSLAWDRARRLRDGVEHGPHDQSGELVEVERAVAGLVAVAGVVVEVSEERPDAAEDLQPGEVAERVGARLEVRHARRL